MDGNVSKHDDIIVKHISSLFSSFRSAADSTISTAAVGSLETMLVVRLYDRPPVSRLMSPMLTEDVFTVSSNERVRTPLSMSKSKLSSTGSPSSFTNILTGTKAEAALGFPSASWMAPVCSKRKVLFSVVARPSTAFNSLRSSVVMLKRTTGE